MAKKIVDETLKFTVVIAGNEAQKEYGKLSRAQKKLVEENKDLEKQAEKLRKANKQNTEEYKKLTTSIDANNKTVKEQETRMSALSKEIGINNLTTRQLNKEARKLKGILSNLTPGTDDWKKYNKQLQSVQARQANLREEMRATEMTLEDQEKALGQLTIGFSQLYSGMKSGNYTDVSDGLRTITGGIKSATKAGLAFIATPIGAAIAVLAGIAFVVKEWFNYNDAIKESVILTEQITRLQGEQADVVRNRATAISETFNDDFAQLLRTANGLSERLSISVVEALDKIEEGYVKGANAGGDYLNQLDEQAARLIKGGASLEEVVAIIEQSQGVFRNDKFIDSLGESVVALEEFTQAQRDALENAFGEEFANEISQGLNDGSLTALDALSKIEEQSEKTGLTTQQWGAITADVFKGVGEDIGGAEYILDKYTESIEKSNRALTPLEQSTKNLADANLDLAKAQDEALKSDNYVSLSRDIQLFWTKTKTIFFQSVSYITDLFTSWTDFLVVTIISTISTFKQLPNIITKGFSDIKKSVFDTIKTFGGLGDVFQKLISLDFSGAKKSAIEFKNNFSNAFNGVKESANDTLNRIIATKKAAASLAQEKLDKNRQGNVASVNAQNPDAHIGSNNNTENTVDAERQKAIDEAVRKKQAVQDAINKFDEEQAIRDQLKQVEKDQQAEEEAVLRKELEFVKLTEEAAGDTELLAQLETAKLNEIQAIRDSFAEQRLAKDEATKKKLAAQEQAYKDNLAKAENNFQQAKSRALQYGLQTVAEFLGKETALGKALFLFQKGKAIADIIRSTSIANATALANEIKIPFFIPPGIPNPVKGLSVAATTKNIAANKINAGVQIASIAASAIKGFEKGLYPVTRAQDGKRFNTQVSTDTSTRLVNKPTTLVGERPEMIIDPNTLNRMNPNVVDYILQLAGKRPMQGYESGLYKEPKPTNDASQPITTDPIMAVLADAINNLVANGVIAKMYYGIENELERQEIEDKITATKLASKN